MLAAQLRARHTAFGLAENWKNLGFAISRHLHQNLLRYPAKKISLPHPLSFRGDYLSNGNESKKVHEAGKGWLTTHPQSIHFVLFCWVKSIEIFSLFLTHLHSFQIKSFKLIDWCPCISGQVINVHFPTTFIKPCLQCVMTKWISCSWLSVLI